MLLYISTQKYGVLFKKNKMQLHFNPQKCIKINVKFSKSFNFSFGIFSISTYFAWDILDIILSQMKTDYLTITELFIPFMWKLNRY